MSSFTVKLNVVQVKFNLHVPGRPGYLLTYDVSATVNGAEPDDVKVAATYKGRPVILSKMNVWWCKFEALRIVKEQA